MYGKEWIHTECMRREADHSRKAAAPQVRKEGPVYAGPAVETCSECGKPTGRVGDFDDSLFTDDGEGPFCEDCWDHLAELG